MKMNFALGNSFRSKGMRAVCTGDLIRSCFCCWFTGSWAYVTLRRNQTKHRCHRAKSLASARSKVRYLRKCSRRFISVRHM